MENMIVKEVISIMDMNASIDEEEGSGTID